jgi:pimeloyl-ACP methyl ester carboxylesterase
MADGVDVEVVGPRGPVGTLDWGGSGDPILFLHGGGTNAAEWAPVVPYLVGDFRCVGLDNYGHGRTPAPSEMTFEGLLDNVDAVIDSLDLPRERLTLVGGSFGGALAAYHQATRPGCRAVVAVDSIRTADVEAWPPPDHDVRTADDWRAEGWGWEGDAAAFETRVAELVADGDPEPCVRRSHVLGTDGTYREVPTPEVIVAFSNIAHPADNPLVLDRPYQSLRCPTLLVCGTEGNAADNRGYVDAMPGRFPWVSVIWMEGPHALDWADPETVALHIREFLTSQPGTARSL